MLSDQARKGFWSEAVAIQGSITLKVLPSVLLCGVIASVVCGTSWLLCEDYGSCLQIDIVPFGFAGVVLGILLVIRLNAGYDRWWEARTLWGGIMNQSRNLAINAMTYGPDEAVWKDQVTRWTAAFPHATRLSLRGQTPSREMGALLGAENIRVLANSLHMPTFVSWRIGLLLQDAIQKLGMSGFAFLQIDRERALLMEHVGACERILSSPLPRIYSITIRRFILLFLILLPAALLAEPGEILLVPAATMLIAYPLLSLDQIGVELENPFTGKRASHLSLDEMCETIELSVRAIAELARADSA